MSHLRARLLILSIVALAASACGAEASGGVAAARPDTQPATTSDARASVRIELGDAEPLAQPDPPVVAATVPAGASTVSSVPTAGAGVSAAAATAPTTSPPADEVTTGSTASAGSIPAASSGPRSSVVAQAVVASITPRSEPSDDAAPVATLDHPTPVGSPLVFLVVDGAAPVGWLQVRLPVQPNGTTGWVRREEVTLFENPYRIEIDRAEHRLQVFHLGQPWLETAIAVGTGATPTPVGEFYLLELLAPPDPTGPYGPYAFGLSGFSEVLDSFGGADTAIIGLHGTDEPEALGTDVSFGCIRLANEVMEQLATTLPLGTPVRIT